MFTQGVDNGGEGGAHPFPFTILVFPYLFFQFIDLRHSEREQGTHSDESNLLLARSLRKLTLQLVYLFEEVVVALSAVTCAFHLP